jgi:hypothetical protein
MNKEQLLQLKLEALRTLAIERGILNAAALTRIDLITRLTDEDGPALRTARPERSGFDVPSSTVHPHMDELETLTMARLYAAEGQIGRAIEIYDKLHALDPDDEEVRAALLALRERVKPTPPPTPAPARPEAETPPAPSPAAHSLPSEPHGMLDLEELPETYGVDECELLYKDPLWVFVYWEVTEQGLAGARAQLGPSASSARLVLRLFSTLGNDRHLQDVDLNWNHGRRYFQTPQPGAHLRAAVGLLSLEGYFAPIAHSSLSRLPPVDQAPEGPVDWMEVVPGKTRGKDREPLVLVRRGHDHAERGARPQGGEERAHEPGAPSSGRWNPGSGSGSPTGGR